MKNKALGIPAVILACFNFVFMVLWTSAESIDRCTMVTVEQDNNGEEPQSTETLARVDALYQSFLKHPEILPEDAQDGYLKYAYSVGYFSFKNADKMEPARREFNRMREEKTNGNYGTWLAYKIGGANAENKKRFSTTYLYERGKL